MKREWAEWKRTLGPVSSQFNEAVIEDFRAHAGEVTDGPFAGRPILLLSTVGQVGEPYTVPLSYSRDGDGHVMLASLAGSPIHPRWFRNLALNPAVTIEVGSERMEAVAEAATGAERNRLFAQQAERLPQFVTYQARTTRQIPVVVIRPSGHRSDR